MRCSVTELAMRHFRSVTVLINHTLDSHSNWGLGLISSCNRPVAVCKLLESQEEAMKRSRQWREVGIQKTSQNRGSWSHLNQSSQSIPKYGLKHTMYLNPRAPNQQSQTFSKTILWLWLNGSSVKHLSQLYRKLNGTGWQADLPQDLAAHSRQNPDAPCAKMGGKQVCGQAWLNRN